MNAITSTMIVSSVCCNLGLGSAFTACLLIINIVLHTATYCKVFVIFENSRLHFVLRPTLIVKYIHLYYTEGRCTSFHLIDLSVVLLRDSTHTRLVLQLHILKLNWMTNEIFFSKYFKTFSMQAWPNCTINILILKYSVYNAQSNQNWFELDDIYMKHCQKHQPLMYINQCVIGVM